jgi:hypothetical protein
LIEVPKLATAPARVIIKAAFVLFKGREMLALPKELQTIAEQASSPSSWADWQHLPLEVNVAAFLDCRFDDVFTAVTDGEDRAGSSRCAASDETPSGGMSTGMSPLCGATTVSSVGLSPDEVGDLSVESKGTFDIEDKTDVVCNSIVIAVEDCDDVVAFEDNDLLPGGAEVVPQWEAFLWATDVLHISCISSKYGQTVLQRFWKIVFCYNNYEYMTKVIRIWCTLPFRKDLTKSSKTFSLAGDGSVRSPSKTPPIPDFPFHSMTAI